MYYIGVDLGTSAVKLLLMEADGTIRNVVSKEYPLYFPHPGWSEQKPEDWWNAVVEGIQELVPEETREKVAGMSFGGQMHGLVMLDENDEVIRPAILWNDGRTGKETNYLNEVIGKDKLSEYTANIAFAGFTVTFNFFFAPTSSVAFFAIVIFFAFTAAFVLSIVTGDAKTDTAIINAITNAVTFPLFIFLLLLYRFASFIVFSSCTIMNFTLYIACSSTHFDKIVSKSLYFHEILYKTLHDLYFSFTLDNIWISDLSG